MLPGIFGQFLDFNIPMPSHQQLMTQEMLEDVDGNFQQTLTEIQARTDEKLMNVSGLHAKRSTYVPLLSLLRGLPAEILLEIFSHISSRNSLDILPASHVCKLWRRIILGTPSLWTKLYMGDTPHLLRDSFRKYVATCVERACGRPLSLIIEGDVGSWAMECDEILDLIVEMTQDCPWTSMSLIADDGRDILPILDDRMSPCSRGTVMKLTLTNDKNAYYDLTEWIPPVGLDLHSFTGLRELVLEWNRDITARNISIAWSQLTSLTIAAFMPSTPYLDILRECVNLESCSINPYEYEERHDYIEPVRSLPPVHLNHLKRLQLKSRDIPFNTLQNIRTPRLEEFIARAYMSNPHDMHGYFSFIDQCAPTLRKLQLPGEVCQLEEFAKRLPSLVVLQDLITQGWYSPRAGDSSCDSDGFLKALTVDEIDMQSAPLPRLEALQILGHPVMNAATKTLFVKMLASRCRRKEDDVKSSDVASTRALRRVKLRVQIPEPWNISRDLKLEDSDDLQTLYRQGLNMDFWAFDFVDV